MCTCVGDAVTESGKSPEPPCNSRAFRCIKCRTPGLPPTCMTKLFPLPELQTVTYNVITLSCFPRTDGRAIL
jgi:hypothetical protein